MKISLATSAFNIVKNKFDIEDAISNWSNYVDEIVIGTIDSEDDTLEVLGQIRDSLDIPIKIIKNYFDTSNPDFDGRIKDSAHQAASHEVVAQIDLDERMGGNPEIWRNLAQQLVENKYSVQSIMMPSVDLWESYFTCSDINFKWYLSIKEGTHRGVVKFAQTENGFDGTKSDSCEILDENDDLVSSVNSVERSSFQDPLSYCQAHMPFVWHLGYLDLDRRVDINKNLWKDRWDKCIEGGSDVITNKRDLEKKEIFEHNIQLDFL